MAKTLSTLRSDFYNLIDEVEGNSHVSATQANGFINEAIQKIAVKVHNPRKFDSGTQVTQDDADYDAPSDFVYLVGAYFGDEEMANDKVPLIIVRESGLKEMNPAWLDRTDASQGRPTHLIFADRNTFMLYPRPNAAESETGKKLWLYYSYLPATLSSDSGEPDIPDAYHDVIKYYASYLAYLGKLNNPVMAASNLNIFENEIEDRMPAAEKEAEELMAFQFGFVDE